jgi:hypothetical protein
MHVMECENNYHEKAMWSVAFAPSGKTKTYQDHPRLTQHDYHLKSVHAAPFLELMRSIRWADLLRQT